MKSRIPSDAFDFYVAQGEHRSYQATADHYGVSKCAISKCAQRESWAERLAKIESEARSISDRKLTESLADMQERHAKTLRAIHVRAIEALRAYPIDNCVDAVKAAEMVIRMERLMAGEASKRTELSIEEITRHEMRTLLKVVHDDDEPRTVEVAALVEEGEHDDGPDGDDS